MDKIRNLDTTFNQQFSTKDFPIFRESMQSVEDDQFSSDRNKQVNYELEQKIETEVNKLNESVELIQQKFKYKIHKDTNRLMIQVIDSNTSEVIKEIPPEKILDMVAKIEKMIGLIIDEKI